MYACTFHVRLIAQWQRTYRIRNLNFGVLWPKRILLHIGHTLELCGGHHLGQSSLCCT